MIEEENATPASVANRNRAAHILSQDLAASGPAVEHSETEKLRAIGRELLANLLRGFEPHGRSVGEARRDLTRDGEDIAEVYDLPVAEVEQATSRARYSPGEQRAGEPSGCVTATPKLVRLSDVKPERVSWLWPGRVPFGKLTVLDGDPGLGKSMITLDIAARLTKGRPFPDGASCELASVVLLSAEDGLADTIRPRLDAVDADSSRVVAVPVIIAPEGAEMLPNIVEHLPQIQEALRKVSARLLVVDPLMAYLGREINSYRDQDVRGVLAPLAALAERTGAAVLLVRHLRKGSRADGALYAGGGSIGIAAASRSVLLVAKDPDDDDRRIVAAVKSNLCKTPPSLAYRIEEDEAGRPWIAWESKPVEITADGLLAAAAEGEEGRSARAEAREFLGFFLADGSHGATEVFREARRQGLSDKTVRRAGRDLGVVIQKAGYREGWVWSLPEDGQQPSKMPISESRASSASSGEVGHLREDEPPPLQTVAAVDRRRF